MFNSLAAAAPHRLTVVVSHPIQHFCPFYQALARDPRIRLSVLFASQAGAQPYWDPAFKRTVRWPANLTDGFDHEFLSGSDRPGAHVPTSILTRRLAAFSPDAVLVYGFFQRASRDAIRWARHHRKAVLVAADSELRQRRNALTRLRKRLMLPPLLARIDAFLTAGDSNEAYYAHYGVPPARMFRCPLPLDEVRMRKALRDRETWRQAIRGRLSLPPDAVVALGVGKFTAQKRFQDAVRAVTSLWKEGLANRIFLVLAGSGEYGGAYREIAAAACPEAIRFTGFVPAEELPFYYVGADLLVHPSEADAHPLATSEAVMCGLPVVASNRVGSVGPTDDVQPGRNGFEYECGDVGALAGVLRRLALAPELLRAAAAESAVIAKGRGLDSSVEGLLRALDSVRTR